jgi:hypothetical protein
MRACACACMHVALLIQHATRVRHIVTSFVALLAPPSFSTLPHKGKIVCFMSDFRSWDCAVDVGLTNLNGTVRIIFQGEALSSVRVSYSSSVFRESLNR